MSVLYVERQWLGLRKVAAMQSDSATFDTSRGRGGLVDLTRALCDTESVSGNEAHIADVVEATLHAVGGLDVVRHGNTVVARTHYGRSERIVLAGHLDTVPVAQNLPSQLRDSADGPVVWGRGTVDMKAGVAVFLQLAADLAVPAGHPRAGASAQRDVTFIFYDNEEVASDLNGLGHVVRDRPDLMQGDFAILGEPSSGGIEGGCNGTLRVHVQIPGVTAHSARSWMGTNAIHASVEVLRRLAAYEPRTVEVDGLEFREGMNAVRINGGIAGNVIPDRCTVTVNYRFAPSRTPQEAEAHVRDLFDGFVVEVDDLAPGARPGLDAPLAMEFVASVLAATGGVPLPKYGWTDVARFAELGIPAVNFGPGDPLLAHKDDEQVLTAQITDCYDALHSWITGRVLGVA